MEIDFTRLKEELKKKAPKESKNGLNGQNGALRELQQTANRRKWDIDKSIEVYKRYQDNIKKSELLQTEILQGIERGESEAVLLLKAVKIISLMTDNPVFYNQVEKQVKGAYYDT